jgi:hypothetical protein
MNARRLGLLLGLAVLAAWGSREAYAADKHDYFIQPNTLAVALTGGDTPNTYSVSCSSNTPTAGATQLRPAVTDRSRRKVCFANRGNVTVVIGSSTVAASDYYVLGEATSTAVSSQYCTNASGAYYCAPNLGNGAQTVVIIEEMQSVP